MAIPQKYKKFWNKEHFDLSETAKAKMVEIYLTHVKGYESGEEKEKLAPPKFMTQEDSREAERKKRKNAIAIVQKEEEERKEKQKEQLKKKTKEIEKAEEERKESVTPLRDVWDDKRVIILDKVERLEIENYQLKMELAQKTIEDLQRKKRDFSTKQENTAKEIEKKYEILMDNYLLDLATGICQRKPDIKFPS